MAKSKPGVCQASNADKLNLFPVDGVMESAYFARRRVKSLRIYRKMPLKAPLRFAKTVRGWWWRRVCLGSRSPAWEKEVNLTQLTTRGGSVIIYSWLSLLWMFGCVEMEMEMEIEMLSLRATYQRFG